MANSSEILAKNIERIFNQNRLLGYSPTNQTELARLMGVSQAAVNQFMKGKVTLKTLDKLSEALGVSPHDLLFEGKISPNTLPKIAQILDMLERALLLKATCQDAHTIHEALSKSPFSTDIPLDNP